MCPNKKNGFIPNKDRKKMVIIIAIKKLFVLNVLLSVCDGDCIKYYNIYRQLFY
jgi:hypothetical protein